MGESAGMPIPVREEKKRRREREKKGRDLYLLGCIKNFSATGLKKKRLGFKEVP